jgi:hypothetical protein
MYSCSQCGKILQGEEKHDYADCVQKLLSDISKSFTSNFKECNKLREQVQTLTACKNNVLANMYEILRLADCGYEEDKDIQEALDAIKVLADVSL